MPTTTHDVSLLIGTRTRCNCRGCNTLTHCEFVGEPVRDIDSDVRGIELASYCGACITVHPQLDQLKRADYPSINDLNQ